MKPRHLLFILPVILIVFLSTFGGAGCANIVPPAGGPRDSVPPQIVKKDPGDSTRNFKGNRINFTFDEFVEVENAYQQLLVSPTPKIVPTVDYRLNTVSVRLKDTLEPNTTYTINFGEAIRDINEKNILKNFIYTFSTGPYIDSLTFSGNVLLAETGKVDTSLMVMLHSNMDDSAVVKEKPRYVARLNGKGEFTFRNLPPKTYRVYAIKDEGGTLRYFDNKQLFAFADSPVVVSDSTPRVTMFAYAVPQVQQAPVSGRTPGSGPRVRGNNGAPVDRRLKISTNLVNGQQDLLDDLVLSFDQPLRRFDTTKIFFATDSTFTPVTEYKIELDSTRRKARVTHSWTESKLYHLVLDTAFAEDSMGKKLLLKDTLSFQTKRKADYGGLKIRARNLDFSRNPVLLLVVNDVVSHAFPLTSADLVRPMFLPGEYELRILYDTNKNGKWDPGDFFDNHRQPEIVKPVGRSITVRPNWENEFEIAL